MSIVEVIRSMHALQHPNPKCISAKIFLISVELKQHSSQMLSVIHIWQLITIIL